MLTKRHISCPPTPPSPSLRGWHYQHIGDFGQKQFEARQGYGRTRLFRHWYKRREEIRQGKEKEKARHRAGQGKNGKEKDTKDNKILETIVGDGTGNRQGPPLFFFDVPW